MCSVPHCSVSKFLMKHWNICKIFNCSVCGLLRQSYGHAKLSKKGTPTNFNKGSTFAKLMPNSSRTAENPCASNRLTKLNSSLSTVASKNHETIVLPKPTAPSQRQLLLSDEYKPSKSPRCDLQEKSTCHSQLVEETFSELCQTGWDFPFGCNDLGENLNHILWSDSLEEDVHQETPTKLASKSELQKI